MGHFERYTDDLLRRTDIQRLARRSAHHFQIDRLAHSVATAKLSYVTARLIGADARVAARAAILHDWYFEGREDHENRVGANVHHYKISALNARGIGEQPAVIDAIETHMWPYGRRTPASREAWIVWMADNLVWVTDGVLSLTRYLRAKYRYFLYGPPSITSSQEPYAF